MEYKLFDFNKMRLMVLNNNFVSKLIELKVRKLLYYLIEMENNLE